MIERCERRRSGPKIGRCLHTDGSEEGLRDVIFETLAGNLLDDVGRHGGAGVAVGHAGARRQREVREWWS